MVCMICREGGVQISPFPSTTCMCCSLVKNLFSKRSHWLDIVNSALTPTGEYAILTVRKIQIVSSCCFWHQIPHSTNLYFWKNASVLFSQKLHKCSMSFNFYCMDGDSNDKPMAMQSWSVARSQCCTSVSIGNEWLSAPDGIQQYWQQSTLKKACCEILTRDHPHLPGLIRLTSTLLG